MMKEEHLCIDNDEPKSLKVLRFEKDLDRRRRVNINAYRDVDKYDWDLYPIFYIIDINKMVFNWASPNYPNFAPTPPLETFHNSVQ